MKTKTNGFTLIEIAIVLVIVGLMLGGVLKGEELIRAARVRNVISDQQGIKTAFYAFQDRYRAIPGDYAAADTNLNCGASACVVGDGNGRIEEHSSAGIHERIMVWSHLSAGGFLNATYVASGAEEEPADTNTPKNPYGVYIRLAYDNEFGAANGANRHNLKTAGQIPVELMAEVDRKIDDGNPMSGAFQFSTYAPTGALAPSAAQCVTGNAWNIGGQESNCGAASLF